MDPCYPTTSEKQNLDSNTRSAEVRIRYFETSTPETVFHTDYIQTKLDNACVANFILHHIEPSKNYSYAIEIGGTISKPYYFLKV